MTVLKILIEGHRNMYRLPDDSGFCVGLVGGPRQPGLIEFIKYRPNGSARLWLFRWRMFLTAHWLSREPDQGPPMSWWRCFRYAMSLP